jgi:hypothetical protein
MDGDHMTDTHRPCAITVISKDGENTLRHWHLTETEQTELANAGIRTDLTPDSIDDDGLYEVEIEQQTANVIADWRAPNGGWELHATPAWADDQRGEGAIWLQLSSGTWVGIAPIDLED